MSKKRKSGQEEKSQSYNLLEPWKTLDKWQKEYIEAEGNCFLLCGRQSGKTAAMSIKFGRRAVKNKDRTILMLAFTEKQAYNLFFKTLMYLEACYPKMIKRGKDKPTKHEINLKNGSKIMCYAAGLTGEGIRTYTVTDLVIDEAAPMAREVFIATMPMLSVTGGALDVSSTPRGKSGFFYECSLRDDFKKFYVSAEDCPRHDKKYLEEQKKTMSELEYAQEYLAMFLDELRQFFPDELIKEVCILKRTPRRPKRDYYMGLDIAGMGKDETTYEILDGTNKKEIIQVENIIKKKQRTTETAENIIQMDKFWRFNKIGLDDGGLGVGVFDYLLEKDNIKRKVIALNNAKRNIDREGKRSKKLLKEDMYNNLLAMMERREIKLLDDKEILLSLKSVQGEYINGKFRIFGNYTHIAEGLIRAAWLIKAKRLNIWVA